MPKPRAVVLLPALFGTSLSFWWHWLLLKLAGYHVVTVDVYKGQAFRRPFFLKIVAGSEEERMQKINALAARLDEQVVMGNLERAVGILRRTGYLVSLVGYGIGGTFALKWAERYADSLACVVAIFPHLVYPEGFPRDRVPPDFNRINGNCTLALFFGKDDAVTPESVAEAHRVEQEHPGVVVHIMDNAGHAYTERFIQWCFPSPLYCRAASWLSWEIMKDFLKRGFQIKEHRARDEEAALASKVAAGYRTHQ